MFFSFSARRTDFQRFSFSKITHQQHFTKDFDDFETEFYFIQNAWIPDDETDGEESMESLASSIDADIIVYNTGRGLSASLVSFVFCVFFGCCSLSLSLSLFALSKKVRKLRGTKSALSRARRGASSISFLPAAFRFSARDAKTRTPQGGGT